MHPALARAERESPMMVVTSDVLEIGRRIREGDDVWRGDASMSLCLNPGAPEPFEVWGIDARGQAYLAASAERCDQRLLERLVAGDWQHVNVFAVITAHNDKVRADHERAAQDRVDAAAERLQWAMRRDLGHLEGGTRPFQAVPGRRDE